MSLEMRVKLTRIQLLTRRAPERRTMSGKGVKNEDFGFQQPAVDAFMLSFYLLWLTG